MKTLPKTAKEFKIKIGDVIRYCKGSKLAESKVVDVRHFLKWTDVLLADGRKYTTHVIA